MVFKFTPEGMASEVRAQKVGPYTVIPIGGPNEIKAWREQQSVKEAAWKARKAANDELKKASAMAMILSDKVVNPGELESKGTRNFKKVQENPRRLYLEEQEKQHKASQDTAKTLSKDSNTPPVSKDSMFSKIRSLFGL